MRKLTELAIPIKNLADLYGLEVNSPELTYFISFTNTDQLDAKLTSYNNNVSGIYTYPMQLVYKDMMRKSPLYASDRPYIQVFKIRKDCRIIDDVTYNISDYEKDLVKLNKIYNEEKNSILTEYLASDNVFSWLFSFYLKKPCFDSLLKCLPNYYKGIGVKRNKSKVGQDIYFLCGLLSILLTTDTRNSSSSLKSMKWNSILRRLGYEAIIDRKEGFLSPNLEDDCQAVFLSNKGFTYITTIDNPYCEIKEVSESFASKIIRLFESLF